MEFLLKRKDGKELAVGPSPQLVKEVIAAGNKSPRKRKSPLFEFARYSDLPAQLADLANLAMKENWNYPTNPDFHPHPILYNYLHYTFLRVRSEKKIEYSTKGTHCIFNTGLVTANQEPIYELFQINRNPNPCEWYFVAHAKASSPDLGKFRTFPEQANYFEKPQELVYDTSLELHVNYDHIIQGKNLERFPQAIRDLSPHVIRTLLMGAIQNARQRIRRNYKTAIPQFYHGKMQLLLPLCLESESSADLALAVERWHDHYRAGTVLTLPMALNNARLIARPDTEWLAP